MKIISTNAYTGPNIYAHFPVMRHVLDLGELEQWPTARLGTTYIDALLSHLPGLKEHGCSYRTAGGFERRLREDEGTWLGHVMEHVAIELQNVAGADVSFGRTRSIDGKPGHYNMVFQYLDVDVAREASQLSLRFLHSLLPAELQTDNKPDSQWNFTDELEAFVHRAQRRAFGPSTASLVRAAEERGIPWIRLNSQSLVQFGHGRHQQRIQATTTSKTSNIAVELASDKEETNAILRDLGLPVPDQRIVRSSSDAKRAARRIGVPVVMKPLSGNHGRGVSVNLKTDEEIEAAFEKASQHGRNIVVESFIEGFDHRLLVVDGKLVAAAKRMPGHVIGDGKHTVEELVAIVNQDPRRGIGHEKVLTRLELDEQAEKLLSLSGYDLHTVPPVDEIVFLRATANLSTGGIAIDVTDSIHPDNIAMAERTIKAIGLDIGGVDFLTKDITQSYREAGGGICEVNAGPGFRMHVAPSEGTPRDVAGPVLDMLFPEGAPSSIPIAAITGTNGKTTTSRMLAHILKMRGYTVGLTSTDGVYIDGQLSVSGDMTGPISAKIILRDPSIDAAVMETARGGMLRSGLGFQTCNVAVCLNISSDHLGLKGIDTLEQLAELKRVPIEVATDAAVLNADDVLCLQMADYTEAKTLCYVTMNPAHPLVKRHIQAGGQAVVLEQGMNGQMITLYDNEVHVPLLWAHLIPATLEGRALHNVQNAMFAAALAYNQNTSLDHIRQGLRTFDTSFFQTPGRMNIYNEHPFKVVMDYAHNPAAVKAMCELVERLGADNRKLVVLSAPGDRRDEDIFEIAHIAASHFDHFICRCDDNRRGRGEDEVANMLKDQLLKDGITAEQITVIADEQLATSAALNMATPGDLLLVLADSVKRTWKQIIYFNADASMEAKPSAAPVRADIPAMEFDLDDDLEIISDERGVRIARETGD
ncbi:cyanophycin synthetase [Granulosicoccus antarcticus]|uniref:Cyanophycin synthetase n=1 Tax=Granulosicoccus antarcticus IMCC3135 TaxID=1192854 RepID=A0A2Z2NSG1_9GAMM|nr:cyanophycin synthetase [Granulosicoccus antarcticus]ASJ72951.1 Cyanophycin synthetase [Granulosicoccus antarcticus IMCC3135]